VFKTGKLQEMAKLAGKHRKKNDPGAFLHQAAARAKKSWVAKVSRIGKPQFTMIDHVKASLHKKIESTDLSRL
jgi:hypothetical protein